MNRKIVVGDRVIYKNQNNKNHTDNGDSGIVVKRNEKESPYGFGTLSVKMDRNGEKEYKYFDKKIKIDAIQNWVLDKRKIYNVLCECVDTAKMEVRANSEKEAIEYAKKHSEEWDFSNGYFNIYNEEIHL
jgi:hypothetical protein